MWSECCAKRMAGILTALLLGLAAAWASGGETLQKDPASGLVIAPGWLETRAHCTPCHASRLVIQNRMNRTGWQKTIKWMQEKHNLWPLGAHEPLILDYLAAHYSARELRRVRRKPLAEFPE